MKKLLYLFIASSILFACESNDDDSLSGSDAIIGTWQLTSETENGKELSTECSRKTTVTFSSNGNFTFQGFYSDSGTVCDSDTSSGTWKNDGDSNYNLDFSDGDISTTKISFSQNNTVFSTTDTDDYNGQTLIYIETYKKI